MNHVDFVKGRARSKINYLANKTKTDMLADLTRYEYILKETGLDAAVDEFGTETTFQSPSTTTLNRPVKIFSLGTGQVGPIDPELINDGATVYGGHDFVEPRGTNLYIDPRPPSIHTLCTTLVIKGRRRLDFRLDEESFNVGVVPEVELIVLPKWKKYIKDGEPFWEGNMNLGWIEELIESGEMKPGDVANMEVVGSRNGLHIPYEWLESKYVIIKRIVDAGIILVAPAGNTYCSLDDDEELWERQRPEWHFDKGYTGAFYSTSSEVKHLGKFMGVRGNSLPFVVANTFYPIGIRYNDPAVTEWFTWSSASTPLTAGLFAIISNVYYNTCGRPLLPEVLSRAIEATCHTSMYEGKTGTCASGKKLNVYNILSM